MALRTWERTGAGKSWDLEKCGLGIGAILVQENLRSCPGVSGRERVPSEDRDRSLPQIKSDDRASIPSPHLCSLQLS